MARDPGAHPGVGDSDHGDPDVAGPAFERLEGALERMDSFLSETRDDGETPIAYNRVAGMVVVGNEDGATT